MKHGDLTFTIRTFSSFHSSLFLSLRSYQELSSLIGHVVMNLPFKSLNIGIKRIRADRCLKNHFLLNPSIGRNRSTKKLRIKELSIELRKYREIKPKNAFISNSRSHCKQLSLYPSDLNLRFLASFFFDSFFPLKNT